MCRYLRLLPVKVRLIEHGVRWALGLGCTSALAERA
jgi:hypothetical protein